jgi:hypothetical protein
VRKRSQQIELQTRNVLHVLLTVELKNHGKYLITADNPWQSLIERTQQLYRASLDCLPYWRLSKVLEYRHGRLAPSLLSLEAVQ